MSRNFRASVGVSLVVSLGCSLAFVACASAPLRTETSDAREARAASSVARTSVDPMTALPPAVDVGDAKDGATTLRPPLARDAVVSVIRRFFGAVVTKTLNTLDTDVDDPLSLLSGEPASRYPRGSYFADLTYRMRALPYEQLDVDQVFRADEVQVFAASELGRAGRPSRPSVMQPDELMVRVHVLTTKVGSDTLFEDYVLFILGRDAGRYRIRGVSNIVPN